MNEHKLLLEEVFVKKIYKKRGANGKPYSMNDIEDFIHLNWEEKDGFLEKHTYTTLEKKSTPLVNRENKLTISSSQTQLNFELMFCIRTYLYPATCLISSTAHPSSLGIMITTALSIEGLKELLEENDPTLDSFEGMYTSLCINRELKQYSKVIYYSDLLKNHPELTLTQQKVSRDF